MRTFSVTAAARGAGQAIAIVHARAAWATYALGRCRGTLDETRADRGVRPLAIVGAWVSATERRGGRL